MPLKKQKKSWIHVSADDVERETSVCITEEHFYIIISVGFNFKKEKTKIEKNLFKKKKLLIMVYINIFSLMHVDFQLISYIIFLARITAFGNKSNKLLKDIFP